MQIANFFLFFWSAQRFYLVVFVPKFNMLNECPRMRFYGAGWGAQ
jgi:hypothetical protein